MQVSHPVRSAVHKHCIAWSVLQWVVTMWESPLLNSIIVLDFFRLESLDMSVYNALEPLLVFLLDMSSVNESVILFPRDDVGNVMNEVWEVGI